MTRSLAVLFLLVGAARAQDPAPPERLSRERIRQLIDHLADDDVQTRDEATLELKRAGGTVRRDLEEASHSPNLERAGRADRLLRILDWMRIRIKVPDSQRVPKGTPIPAELRVRHPSADGSIYYEDGFKITLWLMEPFEEPPQEGYHHHGTFSSRTSNGCILSSSDFVKLEPSKEHVVALEDLRTLWEFQVSKEIVEKYPKISLESPTLAGRYKLVATYGYNRAEYLAQCTKGCREHSNPEALWNRCVGESLLAEAQFVIR